MGLRNVFHKTGAVILGVFLALLACEFTLRAAGCIAAGKQKSEASRKHDRLLIFGGDSWTRGADADPGKSFFNLLAADEDLKKISMVNVGYGGNNCFQAVNAIIRYGKIPDVVVINMGINHWHNMGLGEFMANAANYLSDSELIQLSRDMKYYSERTWLSRLRVYKLYCYLVNARTKKAPVSLEMMDRALGSDLFWSLLSSFREQYQDYDSEFRALPKLLRETEGFNLDQKFYFVALHMGFASDGAEKVLKEAGIFHPEKLRIFPYDVYRAIGVTGKQYGDTRRTFMRWSLTLLRKWAVKNNVVVYFQTYPDIKKENQGEYS
ncbi:MAG: SGNH/GDSL hydrolase family protein, partial [Candidatus Omnitrophota bacterium]